MRCRYVHIPVGYDGLDAVATAALARVARECERPIYVHCHHGRHRGPAAAVVMAMSDTDSAYDVAAAVQAMQIIGTSPEYRGLWRAVREYDPLANPGDVVQLPELVEIAKVDDLAAAMARVDRAWDRVLLCQHANWRPGQEECDVLPRHEALLLLEALREARRVVNSQSGDEPTNDLPTLFDLAVASAGSLHEAISRDDWERANVSLDGLRRKLSRLSRRITQLVWGANWSRIPANRRRVTSRWRWEGANHESCDGQLMRPQPAVRLSCRGVAVLGGERRWGLFFVSGGGIVGQVWGYCGLGTRCTNGGDGSMQVDAF